MDIAAAFSDIGLAFSGVFGGPFHDGRTVEQVAPVYDDGGSIVTPGGVAHRTCSVQIDSATQAMRASPSFVEGSMRFIILADTLTGSLNTEARIEVLAGPFVGVWMVSSIERDPIAAGWVGTGRRG